MASNKKGYEIDERAWEIIKNGVMALSVYFQTPQDKKMYGRKVTEVFDKLRAEVREKVIIDGRADNTATGNATASN